MAYYTLEYLGKDYLVKGETGEFIHIAEKSTDSRKAEAIDWLEAGNIPTPYSHTSTWKRVRAERTRLLQQSDWTQLPDVVVDKEAWSLYRQRLRDITNSFSSPTEVVWPTPPDLR